MSEISLDKTQKNEAIEQFKQYLQNNACPASLKRFHKKIRHKSLLIIFNIENFIFFILPKFNEFHMFI